MHVHAQKSHAQKVAVSSNLQVLSWLPETTKLRLQEHGEGMPFTSESMLRRTFAAKKACVHVLLQLHSFSPGSAEDTLQEHVSC